MIALSYLLNVAILVPITLALWRGSGAMDAAFGSDTAARRILTCLYATILLASLCGLALLVSGTTEPARALALVLFPLQILYKAMTIPAVGLQSPVVRTNIVVIVVHLLTLGTMLF